MRKPSKARPVSMEQVYFIRSGKRRLIKIGRARNARTRLAQLQCASPDRLRLLGVIHVDEAFRLESQLHRTFAADRVRGEWFKPSSDLMEVIDGLCWRPSFPAQVRYRAWPGAGDPETVTIFPAPWETADEIAGRLIDACAARFRT